MHSLHFALTALQGASSSSEVVTHAQLRPIVQLSNCPIASGSIKKMGHKNGCFGVQKQNHKRATVLVPLYLSIHADPVVSCHGLERSVVGMSAFYPL